MYCQMLTLFSKTRLWSGQLIREAQSHMALEEQYVLFWQVIQGGLLAGHFPLRVAAYHTYYVIRTFSVLLRDQSMHSNSITQCLLPIHIYQQNLESVTAQVQTMVNLPLCCRWRVTGRISNCAARSVAEILFSCSIYLELQICLV